MRHWPMRPLWTDGTVVRPHPGDIHRDKVPAALSVINGFGRSAELVQIEELVCSRRRLP
jgi:D-aminopeptidase